MIHQIATTYDMMGDFKNAVKWFEMLTSLVPNDPGVLARLGAIHARFDDEAKALHYYQVGFGVRRQVEKNLFRYYKACAWGSLGAERGCGCCSSAGLARAWRRRAAEAHLPAAT